MDPTSLDPRLRDAGEDTITVNNSTQDSNNAAAIADNESSDDESPSRQLQAPSVVSSVFSPQTPGITKFAPAPDTPAGTVTGAPQDPNDPKRPRACEACRGLKVKCEPGLDNPDGPCRRCAKAGRDCIVTQPTRKRQKKTDSRVAELERKIDALTASLQASRGDGALPSVSTPTPTPTPATPAPSLPPQRSSEDANTRIAREWAPVNPFGNAANSGMSPAPTPQPQMGTAGQKRKFSAAEGGLSSEQRGPALAPMLSNDSHSRFSDVVDRGIITADEASALFQRYTDRMAPHLPAVIFPSGTTIDDIRRFKPILFLALMSVASSETPATQRILVRDLMDIFANKIIIRGEKSLELVQSIMVSVIWYFPPEHFEELKFYQMIHIAGVMALDIGLGRRPNNPKAGLIPYTWRDHPFRKQPLPDPSSIEARRTWLAVYFLASNVAMALHRPNLIRWQPFMTECMDILESSPDAAPTDRYLCHLVWTHHLAEEVGIQFSMDDPSVSINITDQKVQYALRGFERDLERYSENIPKEDRQPSLLLSFNVLNLYMHEIALYVDKNDGSAAPSNPESLREPIPDLGDSLTAAHISALSSCLTAIDGIFETFLALDVASIRCLPIFNFVRVAYAVVILIKLYYSASSPNSELGKVINKDQMKVAEYLDKLLEKFREATATDKSRPAGKFLVVLLMMRGWFNQQGKGQGRPQNEWSIDPTIKQPHVQNTSSVDPSKHKDSGPKNAMPNERQQRPPQQNKPQSEYKPTNTPLQVLSEIATSKGPTQSGSDSNPSSAPTPSPSAYTTWVPPRGQQLYSYGHASGFPPTTVASGYAGMANANQPPAVSWMDGATGGEIDYLTMGDGFEQAMDLTLTGFGGGIPGDLASYENTLRMMVQNDAAIYAGFYGQ